MKSIRVTLLASLISLPMLIACNERTKLTNKLNIL